MKRNSAKNQRMRWIRFVPLIVSVCLVPFAGAAPSDPPETCADLMMIHFFPESRVQDVIWYEGTSPPVHFGRIQARLKEIQKLMLLEKNSYSRTLARLTETKAKAKLHKDIESLEQKMSSEGDTASDLESSLKSARRKLFSVETFQNTLILEHLKRGHHFELQLSAIYLKLSEFESRYGLDKARVYRKDAVQALNRAELFRRELEARLPQAGLGSD